MAKSRMVIQLNYEAAKRQAQKLDEIAGTLTNVADRQLNGCFGQLQTNWKGDNANAYLNKGNVVQDDIRTTAANVKNAAESIRKIAKRTYDADMAAVRMAETRMSR